MRIVSLELVRYKRLQLNNIERFIIKPTQIIQLILGTNGSGKSSLIKELTPLPADPHDYHKGGSKTIHITHRGSKYVLKNMFESGNKHSFMKDEEELNPGGTITVQKELVRQEFNVTVDRHELLTGQERFTAMTPARRREWFTQLSDINYDYALSVYGRLKDRSRDLTGALRMAKKRLVTETAKVISQAEETKLRHDVEMTLRELNLLIEQSAPLDRPVAEYENDQTHGLEELKRLSLRLLRMRSVAPYGVHPYGIDPRKEIERDDWGQQIHPTFQSVADIDSLLDELRHKVTAKEAVINKLMSEHTTIHDKVQVLMKVGEEGLKSLRDKMQVIEATRLTHLRNSKLGLDLAASDIAPQNAISALDTVYDILSAVFMQLPQNEEKQFSRARLQELQDQLLVHQNAKLKKTAELNEYNTRLQHLESHKANGSIACPQCHHTWVVGYDDKRAATLKEWIAARETDLSGLDKEIVKVELSIKEIQDYSTLYRDYVNCVRNWPALSPLWDYLGAKDYIARSPKKALSVVDTFRLDLQHELAAAKCDEEIREIAILMQSAEQVGDANLNEMKLKLEECSHQIDTMTAELTKLQTEVTEYSRYRSQMLEAQALAEKIKTLQIFLENNNGQMIEMLRRETLNHCVRQLQHALAIKQETLNAAIIQKSLVEDLETQIERLTVEEEAAKLLVRELSPTDGLIAEGLLGFIRKFVNQMNNLIRKIWTYPLLVQDCAVVGAGGAELDYKFPLMVSSKDNVVSDVSKGSSGMQEIIDLAFRVTTMHFLGLSESPLYLDEFGKTFDEAHRSASGHVIKALMDQKPFTQLFMVSHYDSTYGAFTNSEICVLCPSNITVPDKTTYNQHVIMT